MEIIILLCGFGIAVGAIVGKHSSKNRKEMVDGVLMASVIAAVTPLFLIAAWTTFHAITTEGHTIIHALMQGNGAAFLMCFSVPWIAGLPAAIAAALAHGLDRSPE